MEHDKDDILNFKASKRKIERDMDRLEHYRDINLNYEDESMTEDFFISNSGKKSYICTGYW